MFRPKPASMAVRLGFTGALPEFADRTNCIVDWRLVSFLLAESSCCERWYKDGLLLIGDAAYMMSPVGGVRINYAVQDAVVAANILARPLKEGGLRPGDPNLRLAAMQQRRELPTRLIQSGQALIQRRVLADALDQRSRSRRRPSSACCSAAYSTRPLHPHHQPRILARPFERLSAAAKTETA